MGVKRSRALLGFFVLLVLAIFLSSCRSAAEQVLPEGDQAPMEEAPDEAILGQPIEEVTPPEKESQEQAAGVPETTNQSKATDAAGSPLMNTTGGNAPKEGKYSFTNSSGLVSGVGCDYTKKEVYFELNNNLMGMLKYRAEKMTQPPSNGVKVSINGRTIYDPDCGGKLEWKKGEKLKCSKSNFDYLNPPNARLKYSAGNKIFAQVGLYRELVKFDCP